MILEGLVTTRDADGRPHLAPMGPKFENAHADQFVLRPFRTSQSYRNLLKHPEGVLHLTDDALLMARAAIGRVGPVPPHSTAEKIAGFVLNDCCGWLEFRITEIDNRDERVIMAAKVELRGIGRPWFGFNRAKHAVVEAAILATRVHMLPRKQIETEFCVLAAIVEKTGGPAELDALRLLQEHVRGSP